MGTTLEKYSRGAADPETVYREENNGYMNYKQHFLVKVIKSLPGYAYDKSKWRWRLH